MTTALLNLQAPRNFRDAGGGLTRGGRRVRSGLLFRSGSLHTLASADARALKKLVKPRTLLDLRSPQEAEAMPVASAHLAGAYVNIPLVWGGGSREIVGELPPESLAEVYEGMARTAPAAIAGIFDALCEPGAFPAVIFCAAGKDRTGVVTALLLGALNVEDEWIIDDYALSGKVDPATLGEGYVERTAHFPPEFHTSPPEVMAGFLASLRRAHGSVRAFLTSAGVKAEQLVALEHALLD